MSIKGLCAVLLSAGILLGGNGLLGTLIAVRADAEGFSESVVGFTAAGFFAGFIIGSLLVGRLIERAGHIRVFAALAALAAIACLLMVLWPEPFAWIALRGLMGFCFCGTSMVIESWLNATTASARRGRILSVYRIVDLSAVTGAQFLIPLFGAQSFEIFAITTILFCGALVPIALSRLSSPPAPTSPDLKLGLIWRLSPTACMGCIAVGLTNSSFRNIGPLFAQSNGFSIEQVAWFMSLGILAGALCQYPLGWLSDRFDRRRVLLIGTVAAVFSSMVLSLGHGNWLYLGAFLFGGATLPLYSLSAAHANDHAEPGQYVQVAAGLTLFYSLGALFGPIFSSNIIQYWGPSWFFVFTGGVHFLFIGVLLHRMARRVAVPQRLRKRFVALLRTSPAFVGLVTPQKVAPSAPAQREDSADT